MFDIQQTSLKNLEYLFTIFNGIFRPESGSQEKEEEKEESPALNARQKRSYSHQVNESHRGYKIEQ